MVRNTISQRIKRMKPNYRMKKQKELCSDNLVTPIAYDFVYCKPKHLICLFLHIFFFYFIYLFILTLLIKISVFCYKQPLFGK